MNEKQLLDRLKREADTVPLPETLSPEAIERMLLPHRKTRLRNPKIQRNRLRHRAQLLPIQVPHIRKEAAT